MHVHIDAAPRSSAVCPRVWRRDALSLIHRCRTKCRPALIACKLGMRVGFPRAHVHRNEYIVQRATRPRNLVCPVVTRKRAFGDFKATYAISSILTRERVGSQSRLRFRIISASSVELEGPMKGLEMQRKKQCPTFANAKKIIKRSWRNKNVFC